MAAMILGLFPSFMCLDLSVYYHFWALGLMAGMSMIRCRFDHRHSQRDRCLDCCKRFSLTLGDRRRWTRHSSMGQQRYYHCLQEVICRADAQYYTVSIGLWKMLEKKYIGQLVYLSFAAGAVVVSIPIALVLTLTQKFYVDGMSGAVKG